MDKKPTCVNFYVNTMISTYLMNVENMNTILFAKRFNL